jgi:hypothetical protein
MRYISADHREQMSFRVRSPRTRPAGYLTALSDPAAPLNRLI